MGSRREDPTVFIVRQERLLGKKEREERTWEIDELGGTGGEGMKKQGRGVILRKTAWCYTPGSEEEVCRSEGLGCRHGDWSGSGREADVSTLKGRVRGPVRSSVATPAGPSGRAT